MAEAVIKKNWYIRCSLYTLSHIWNCFKIISHTHTLTENINLVQNKAYDFYIAKGKSLQTALFLHVLNENTDVFKKDRAHF